MEPYRERANHELRAQTAWRMGGRLACFDTGARCASRAIREKQMGAVYHGWTRDSRLVVMYENASKPRFFIFYVCVIEIIICFRNVDNTFNESNKPNNYRR